MRAPTQRTLRDGLIPDYLRVSNPVDCGGPPVADARGRAILELLLADPTIDLLVVPITGAVDMFSDPLTRDLVDVASTATKPIFVVWGAPPGTDDTFYLRLLAGGLPVFRTFGNCVRALRAYVDYWQFVARYRPQIDELPTEPLPAALEAQQRLASAGPGGVLSEHNAKQILRAYGVETTRDTLCTSVDAAVSAADELGYPVVLKVSSPALAHKSDLGLVRVGIASDAEVRKIFDELMEAASRAVGADDAVEGVLVCEQVSDGVELVVGVSRDSLFGPVVMAGIGGVFLEVLGDVTFRVPPFGRDEAERMLRELRGFPLLEGVRGAKPVDIGSVVDVLMNVQRLALDLGDADATVGLAELDINPLVATPRGAIALDALAVAT